MSKAVGTEASLKKVNSDRRHKNPNAGVDIKMLFEKIETTVPYQKDEKKIAERIFVKEYKKKYGLR